MANKVEKAVDLVPFNSVTMTAEVNAITPACVVNVKPLVQVAAISDADLPEEFQGQTIESNQSGLCATVKWINPGNAVLGLFQYAEAGVGPNESMLYHFKTTKGVEFGIWGTWGLDRLMSNSQIQRGDLCRIIFIGEVDTEREPCKQFQMDVLKPRPKEQAKVINQQATTLA